MQRPHNLFVVVFDNGLYGETGMQASHTQPASTSATWRAPAAFERVLDVYDQDGLLALAKLMAQLQPHAVRAGARFRPDDAPRVLPEKDGVVIKDRVRAAAAAIG